MLPPVNIPLVGVQPATPVLVTDVTVAITGERPLQLRFRLQTLRASVGCGLQVTVPAVHPPPAFADGAASRNKAKVKPVNKAIETVFIHPSYC
ncbi:MAG: hypothetical protein DHS20C11_35980 [Lysobacteraceae bacterium]|nr:MAG: hypothetical protein DHS20C11_35980 [Xanthomonadaceae bacterium]